MYKFLWHAYQLIMGQRKNIFNFIRPFFARHNEYTPSALAYRKGSKKKIAQICRSAKVHVYR